MSSPAQDVIRRHRYTVEDYHRMATAGILRQDQRVELIKGEIIDMTPIGSRHAATVRQLAKILVNTAGDRAIVSVQSPIELDDLSEPEPDLALLRPQADFYARGHPRPADILLIIEVADNSLIFDRDVKIPLYARQGIAEVWLFDLGTTKLTVYRNPSKGGYGKVKTLERINGLTVPILKDVMVDLSGVMGF
ncbi:MAG TPA: Uma2 family endonuclease [Acidiferrobacteraceae bacterium]|nr:Uma2 family endonuclease [Acidiferrobacteraceae bacterium]